MSLGRRGGVRKSTRSYGSAQDTDERSLSRSSSPRPVSGLQSDDKIKKLRGQVDEVKEIMKDNVEKVIERGEKTDLLRDRTEYLAESSTRFSETATDLRKQTQRRNWKLMCCIVCVIVVVLAIIAIIILYALKII